MRHLCQIGRYRITENVFAESESQERSAVLKVFGSNNLPEGNGCPLPVRHFDTNSSFACNGIYAYARRTERKGQVLGQGNDSVDLDSSGRFELIHRDHGHGMCPFYLSAYPEVGEFSFETGRDRIQFILAGSRNFFTLFQKVHRGKTITVIAP